MSETVYIGLGSNLGDRETNLLLAVEALASIDAVAVLRRSSLYDSAAVGPPQPRFLNAVVEVDCGLAPQRLLGILHRIEQDLGRARSERWAPQPIDLDILLWGSQVIADGNLQIPHLGLHERKFVLEPLCELNAAYPHPVLGTSMGALLKKLGPQDVMPFESSRWPVALSPSP